jgi:hypothetical protein
MSRSIHHLKCSTCGNPLAVSEVPISDSTSVNVHLHGVCENAGCGENQKAAHLDVISGCNGLPSCPVHDDANQHSPYVDCSKDHGCVKGCA